MRGERRMTQLIADPARAQEPPAEPVPSPARGLHCRACASTCPLVVANACRECLGPLEIDYDPDLLRLVTRARIAAGPANMWRYAGLLPVGQDRAARVTLNPGN